MRFLYLFYFLFAGCFFVSNCEAQVLYSSSFGDVNNPAIIFLHGGPGFNSVNFEVTTAQVLAEKGYFVIVYDRRGEGRSTDSTAQFTYQQTFEDLKSLYTKYSIKKASFIGHSFGGIVATKFATAYPDLVGSIIFAAAPIRMQSVFKNIIATARPYYEKKKDSMNLRYISMLEKMDTTSIEYSSYSFSHAMVIGAYTPKKLLPEAAEIYSLFRKDLRSKKAFEMNIKAPKGFWKNEQYTIENLTDDVNSLKKSSLPMYGIYGLDDGLFSSNELEYIENLLGKNNFHRLEHSSHSLYMDTQIEFILTVDAWLKGVK